MRYLVTCWKTPRKRWEEQPPSHCFIEASSRGVAIIDVKIIMEKRGVPRDLLDDLNWLAEPIKEIVDYGSKDEYEYKELVQNEQ